MTRSRWLRPLLIGLLIVTTLAAVMFGIRTYRSFLLLRSAQQLGARDVASLRPWMTLRYVAIRYNVPEEGLVARLGLPAEIDRGTSLRSLATRRGRDPLAYVQEVQRAIAELRRTRPSPSAGDPPTSWLSALGDELIAALLVYGYPALGLTLFAGAVGLPLPSGLSMVVAGSLAGQGHLSWWWASTVAVVASVLGDVTGYGLGWLAGRGLLAQRGRWIGLTPSRLGQVEVLFNRWGALSVVLSRSLLSFLSSAVNLLAGAGRYPMRVFVPSAVVGRVTFGLPGTRVRLRHGFRGGRRSSQQPGRPPRVDRRFHRARILRLSSVACARAGRPAGIIGNRGEFSSPPTSPPPPPTAGSWAAAVGAVRAGAATSDILGER